MEPLRAEGLENESNWRSSSMDFAISSKEPILKFQRFLLCGTSGKDGSETHEAVDDSCNYIIRKKKWYNSISQLVFGADFAIPGQSAVIPLTV